MSNPELPISLFEKIDVIRGIFSIIAVAGYSSIVAIFRGPGVTWAREVITRVVRYQVEALSLTQRRWLRPSTEIVLEKYCRKQSIPLDTVQLAHGAKIHWAGDRSAKKVILYFHGGAYVHAMVPGHAIFLRQCIRKLEESGEKSVLAIVEYGLAPRTRYPTQYIQGAESLRYLLREGYQSSDIIIGGDSAGGNLSLAVISHILHPHPNVENISLPQPFAGVLLISPWVTFADTALSCRSNLDKDYLNPKHANEWVGMFVDDAGRNEYSEPLSADPNWWKGFPAKQTLIVYGDWEVPRDDIKELSEKMKEQVPDLTVLNCQKEVHVACVIDAQFGLEPRDMAKTIFSWLGQVF